MLYHFRYFIKKMNLDEFYSLPDTVAVKGAFDVVV